MKTELDNKTKKLLTKNLNSLILTCLGGPGGDPDRCHREAAATAIYLLDKLGLPVDRDDAELREDLKEELKYLGK